MIVPVIASGSYPDLPDSPSTHFAVMKPACRTELFWRLRRGELALEQAWSRVAQRYRQGPFKIRWAPGTDRTLPQRWKYLKPPHERQSK